jgi:hypothetical protein
MPNFKPLPSLERVNELLSYNEATGRLHWKVSVARWIKIGDEAGTYGHCAVDVTIDKATYRAHRIIWLLVTERDPGNLLIDHVNGDFHDNRVDNLRLATSRQNQCNQKVRIDNTSGLKGVAWDKNRRKWTAAIHVNKKRIALGRYDSKEKAYAAYCEAARKLHGEFARLS